jgi:hypothetical protein
MKKYINFKLHIYDPMLMYSAIFFMNFSFKKNKKIPKDKLLTLYFY